MHVNPGEKAAPSTTGTPRSRAVASSASSPRTSAGSPETDTTATPARTSWTAMGHCVPDGVASTTASARCRSPRPAAMVPGTARTTSAAEAGPAPAHRHGLHTLGSGENPGEARPDRAGADDPEAHPLQPAVAALQVRPGPRNGRQPPWRAGWTSVQIRMIRSMTRIARAARMNVATRPNTSRTTATLATAWG